MVSLFDGISCGRVALERAGYAVSAYEAFETDKYARSISRYNFPDIKHHGDVMDADFRMFTDYDLVMGGSPCTFWSIAKHNREVDKNGMGWKLFMRFVEAVWQIQPNYYLYENVASMPRNIKDFISDELGCEPILINSALVSAQQRKRLYWTNIECLTQPNDKGILLKDILQSGLPYQDKSHCITATYQGADFRSSIEKKKRTMVAEPIYSQSESSQPIALADKSQTILATLYKENALSMVKRQKTGLFVAEAVEAVKVFEPNKTFSRFGKSTDDDGVGAVPNDDGYSGIEEMGAALRTRADENGSFKRLEVREDGKLNALTTVQTDSVICSPVRVGSIGKGGQGERIYSVHGKTVSMSANGGGVGAKTGLYKINLPDGDYTVRKLSVVEAERCQTLDDDFTAYGVDDNGKTVNISNTQRYKAIGNGWTVDVIAHILSHMNGGDD